MNTSRVPDHPIDPLILHRWSPRAMSGQPVPRSELMCLFEAARWAPSSNNGQPWRFVYATRESPRFKEFLEVLVEGNRVWCANAGVLVVMCSRTTFEPSGKPNRHHSFDTGAAWENLALQGSRMGLVVHGMAGFDAAKAAHAIALPPDHQVEAICAVGKPGRKEDLPPHQQEREAPSGRRKVTEFAFEGRFPS